jgi:O-antigen ligase
MSALQNPYQPAGLRRAFSEWLARPGVALSLAIVALLVSGLLEVFAPLLVGTVLPLTSVTREIASMFSALIAGLFLLILLLYLRFDAFMAAVVAVVHLYLDFYLSMIATAQVLTIVLLLIYFFTRSAQRPWIEPRPLWLWLLFLGLTIFPALQGAMTINDALYYYPNVILGSFLFFWLGQTVSRDERSLLHAFQCLAAFGALIAIHTIVLQLTGKFLLGSSAPESLVNAANNYAIGDSGTQRTGGFFTDPNWNGTFFALVLFCPLGLFAHARSLPARLLYLIETLLILPALLFTFSGGAWVAACAGVAFFLLLVDSLSLRLQICLGVALGATALVILFPTQLSLLIEHATGQGELQLRMSAWQTGLNVIAAYPLTGIGFGQTHYLIASQPYRSPGQYVALAHPHDSYLEYGAMGGLPVLIIFLALVCCYLWRGLRIWRRCDRRLRAVQAGGLASIGALCVNSISINGWTLPPLACFGWLILGLISSPLLMASLQRREDSESAGSALEQSPVTA